MKLKSKHLKTAGFILAFFCFSLSIWLMLLQSFGLATINFLSGFLCLAIAKINEEMEKHGS